MKMLTLVGSAPWRRKQRREKCEWGRVMYWLDFMLDSLSRPGSQYL